MYDKIEMRYDLKVFKEKGHFLQKERYSCIPSSARTTIFKKFDEFFPENCLNEIFKTDTFGTTLRNVTELEEIGYKAEVCKPVVIDDIKREDLPVIGIINCVWGGDTTSNHAVTIDKIDDDEITVLDPGKCTTKYGRETFCNLHKGGGNVIIRISKLSKSSSL